MSDNPFEAPKSTVTDIQADKEAGLLRNAPRKNPIGHGWKWIAEGFGLFKKSPLFWILNIIVYFIIITLLSILPVMSLLASLVGPVFSAGLVYGAYELDQGRPLTMGHLFKGFRKNTGSLFAVGGLYLLGVIIILSIAAGVAYATGGLDNMFGLVAMEPAMEPDAMVAMQMDMMKNFLLPGLIAAALFIPLAMAMWFAPVLVILHNMGAIEAMKRSLKGCMKNMFPYLLYGIIVIILMVLSVIPVGLGLLVLVPTIAASIYTAYKDVFLD